MRHSRVLPSVVRNIRELEGARSETLCLSRSRARPCCGCNGRGGLQEGDETHLLPEPGETRFDMGILVLPMVARPRCVPMVHSKYATARLPLR